LGNVHPRFWQSARTLHQLANDEATKYPAVERIISNDLYVDDVTTGADCKSSARQLQQDLIRVFNRGCFELRKWSSNYVALLEAFRQTVVKQTRLPLMSLRQTIPKFSAYTLQRIGNFSPQIKTVQQNFDS